MLTVTDLLKLQKIISETIHEKLKQFHDDYIKYLHTKDEFFTKMLELMGEVKAMRDSQELHSGDHTRINDRLGKHDQHLGISTAV